MGTRSATARQTSPATAAAACTPPGWALGFGLSCVTSPHSPHEPSDPPPEAAITLVHPQPMHRCSCSVSNGLTAIRDRRDPQLRTHSPHRATCVLNTGERGLSGGTHMPGGQPHATARAEPPQAGGLMTSTPGPPPRHWLIAPGLTGHWWGPGVEGACYQNTVPNCGSPGKGSPCSPARNAPSQVLGQQVRQDPAPRALPFCGC